MELLLAVLTGLGLSAACGFRIFVPLLVTSIAAHSGHMSLAPSFQWLASTEALTAFSIATVLEIGGYYVPWLDNFLDTVATPAAIVAGTVVTASMAVDISPFLKWSLAVVAGGGVAGAVQATTVLARGLSLTHTAGMGNPIVATAELGGSIVTAIAAVIAPVFAIALLLLVIGVTGYKLLRRRGAAVPPVITTPAGIA